MPTYMMLGYFTEHGIKNIKQTEHRTEGVRQMASQHGIQVTAFYWTIGQYDIAAILEAPSEEAIAKLMFAIESMGNVRTHTFRIFTESEIVKLT